MKVCDRCRKGELDRSLNLTKIYINEETSSNTLEIFEYCDSCKTAFKIMITNFLGEKGNVSSNTIRNDQEE